jgi:hypothetical protein
MMSLVTFSDIGIAVGLALVALTLWGWLTGENAQDDHCSSRCGKRQW